MITDLFVNNELVKVGKTDSLMPALKKVVSYDKEVKLNYLQNNFVLSFSAMHFANPLNCKYRYRLVDFDADWKYTDGNHPNASYTNLDYKSYNFIVEATNNDGIWSKKYASINVSISPPWWKSTFAKLAYLLLLLSGLSGIYIYQARWYSLKRDFTIRAMEESKREEMHLQREDLYQQQLHFFTNISHEFRTPLTLIIGPLEHLVKENSDPKNRYFYELMYRNAKRLLNLINELMNFRKVADNAISLKVASVNVSNFMYELSSEFEALSIDHNISFKLKVSNDFITSWLDKEVTEKILFNLLNNAIKYTEAEGQIEFEVFFDSNEYKPKYESEYRYIHHQRANNYVHFRVADTGIGISKESIGQIFDRYFRVNNNHLGSGVGLALVKSLIVLHKGDILVSSARQIGTEIIISLPRDEAAYLDTEKQNFQQDISSIKLEKIDHTESTMLVDKFNDYDRKNAFTSKELILIVEDNDELRYFLKNILQQRYYVLEAVNGKQGLDLANANTPDLIISDVMMPLMNGVELCRTIKQQFETSHIPFIILSAKDALDSRLKGLESGADFYFSKPLSTEFLLLTIHNLFEQRQKLKSRFTKDYYAQATELVHSEKDKEFIEKLLKLIEDNIAASDLDVDYLCDKLFTSRSKLYQKIKNISGLAIGDFIRTTRLKKAVHIMTHEDITIYELIERIGFTSASYFSKAFKKEFGNSPSQFLKSVKKSPYNVLKDQEHSF